MPGGRRGIVNFTFIWQTRQREHQHTQLPAPSRSLSHHQSHHVALSSTVFELPEVEELIAERGVTVRYETIRQRQKLWPVYALTLKQRQSCLGSIWQLDEVFVTIQGIQQSLWQAVDQDDNTIDILVLQRHTGAAVRFVSQLLKGQGREPSGLMTDKLTRDDAAHRMVMLTIEPLYHLDVNTRTDVSYRPTRQHEYQMRGGAPSSSTVSDVVRPHLACVSSRSSSDSDDQRPDLRAQAFQS